MTDVTWLDSKGNSLSCNKSSYDKIYSEAARKIKAASCSKMADEEKEKTVDEIAESNEDIIKEKERKLKQLESELEPKDLDEQLESLRAEIDEERESKSASMEFIGSAHTFIKSSKLELIGVESLEPTYRSNILDPGHSYSALSYIPHISIDKSGDALFLELGSSD